MAERFEEGFTRRRGVGPAGTVELGAGAADSLDHRAAHELAEHGLDRVLHPVAVLGVPTLSYAVFAFFNWLSPLLSVLYGFTGFKIVPTQRAADTEGAV